MSTSIRVGLISDTHDLLRPEALEYLRGSARIIHCGDICGPQVIEALCDIAPVTAVRGNNDKGAWAEHLPEYELIQLGGIRLYVIHDLNEMAIDPVAEGVAVVLSGHSHQPNIECHDGILYVNPGSAGPRRFKLPISVAELIIEGESVSSTLARLG